MNRSPSRSASAIVLAFTQARQNLELDLEKRKLLEIVERVTRRRRIREEAFKKPKRKKEIPKDTLREAEKYKNMDEHKIELRDLFIRLQIEPDKGLSTQEALVRNSKFGDNVLAHKKPTPWYIKLLKEFVGSFSLLLWFAAILSFIAYALSPSDPSNFYLAIALIAVILITGFETFYQNTKSESIMESFKSFIPESVKVLRDGSYSKQDAKKLVPGDIVEIRGGDRIPADIRIIFSQEMKVDNSSLTGESEPLIRSTECTHKENPLETANLAFFGTLCKEGVGRGIVINIGNETVIGQIANLALNAEVGESPLKQEMHRFVRTIAIIAVGTGLLLFVIGFLVGYPAVTNLIFGIGILASYVPEGLVTCLVIALTLTAQSLAKKKVLVKNLEAVETLGSTSCICSDKTGTLTQNIMTVENIWYDGCIYKAENFEKRGINFNYEYDKDSKGFRDLHHAAVCSSDAIFDLSTPPNRFERLKYVKNPSHLENERKLINDEYKREIDALPWYSRPVIGDASESALIKFFQGFEDINQTRNRFPVKKMIDGSLAKIPFNSLWKYALSICHIPVIKSTNCIFIKGAPEKVWEMSTHVMRNGSQFLKDEEWETKFKEANKYFGEGGQRVLGLAKLHLPIEKYSEDYQFNCKNQSENNFPMKGFAFIGLISMIDPPRENVPYSILKCKAAGIKVIMVTGDQPVTATAIGRQVNILSKTEKTVNQIMEEEKITFDEAFEKSDSLVIHGDQIMQAIKEDELLPEAEHGKKIQKWLTKPRIIFARTTPAQKLIIVKACQKQGHVVAVTGDGVNDSPAIKQADIGIAMGITGSDVAKDAADMVLLTDDFSAIIIGVEEGRKIFDNLKRAIIYCLTANFPEVLPFLSLIILAIPLPLSTILVLCIDLGFNIIPAITWASEPSEIDIMVRPPRRKFDHLVTPRVLASAYLLYGVFEGLGAFLTYFVIMYEFGFSPGSLFGLSKHNGIKPAPSDVYNPNAPFYGQTSPVFVEYCTNCWGQKGSCDISSFENKDLYGPPDWIYSADFKMDLRLFYLTCTPDGGISSYITNWEPCRVKQISHIEKYPVCYTTDALKYAQTGFYVSVALSQFSLTFVVKTRKVPFYYSSMQNFPLYFGMAWIVMVCLIICYFPPFQSAFFSRELIFRHFAWASVPFGISMLIFNEIRKYLIRNQRRTDSKPNWAERNTFW